MTELLAVVPARAGSKGVPGKNKAEIAGRPLIDYTVAALTASRPVGGILITTDDPDILGLYRGRGDLLVVDRPAALATDEATTGAVVEHALRAWTEAGHAPPQSLLLAQPTTPLRTAAHIDAAYQLFSNSGTDSLISACRAEGMRHPKDMYRMLPDGRGELFIADTEDRSTRHSYERLYQRNGAIYIVSLDYFMREKRLRNLNPVIFEMPWERSINIDTKGDLLIAKALIESGVLDREQR
jgi:N-acylneuraminate cytidylyltransferase/CMP-N,N'-diacetyllegionaminic acid synthase